MIKEGTKSKFAKRVSFLLFVYNLTALIRFYIGRQLDTFKDDHSGALLGFWPLFEGFTENICLVISLTAFNLGNWYFGFYYFKCYSETEFIERNRKDDENKEKLAALKKRNKNIFYAVAVINVLACVSVGIIFVIVQFETNSDYLNNTDESRNYFEKVVIPQMVVGALQIVSFVIVTYSTLKIRDYLCQKQLKSHINMNIMILHMLSFMFYVLSGIGYYIALFNFYKHFSDPVHS